MSDVMCELIVTADSRERDAKRVQSLCGFVGFHGGAFEVLGLPNNGGCDYRVEGVYKEQDINLGIEYKTLTDFSSSYQKLGQRFRNAYNYYDEVALVLEVPKYAFTLEPDGFHGTISNPRVRDGKADVLKYATFQGVLQSIARSGVYVVRIQNSDEFPYALGWLVNYISNPIHTMMDWGLNEYSDQYLSSLSKIPSVGIKKASKIASEYPRYHELVEASQKELQELLGDRGGSAVYEFLHGTDDDSWKPNNTTKLPELGDLIIEYVEGHDAATTSYSEIKKEFENDYDLAQIQAVLIDLAGYQLGTGRTRQLERYFEGDITMYRVVK